MTRDEMLQNLKSIAKRGGRQAIRLSPDEKDEILKLPNFDKKIFKEITLIDV